MIEINFGMEWIPLKNVKGVSGLFTGSVDESMALNGDAI